MFSPKMDAGCMMRMTPQKLRIVSERLILLKDF